MILYHIGYIIVQQVIKNSFKFMNRQTIHRIVQALQNSEVREFVRRSLKDNYKRYFTQNYKEAEELIDKSFNILARLVEDRSTIYGFMEKIAIINDEIYKKDNNEFWFNRKYAEYKKNIRPKEDIKLISKFLNGKKILDFGTGGGYFALKLEKKGFILITSDILDYRIKEAEHLPFKKMYSPVDIKYLPKSIDIALMKTVLHHIDDEYILYILDKLRKKVKRIIIKEDVVSVPRTIQRFRQSYKTQPNLRKFLKMSRFNRKMCLFLFDFFGNVIAHGVSEINLPFNFKSVSLWKKLFDSKGFKLKASIFSGFEKNKLHGNCQVWMVFDNKIKF